jgi:hypothetical protein
MTVLIAVLIAGVHAAGAEEGVSLAFYVEHEVELDRDYLELVVEVKAEDTSLKTALEDAAETVAFVRN